MNTDTLVCEGTRLALLADEIEAIAKTINAEASQLVDESGDPRAAMTAGAVAAHCGIAIQSLRAAADVTLFCFSTMNGTRP